MAASYFVRGINIGSFLVHTGEFVVLQVKISQFPGDSLSQFSFLYIQLFPKSIFYVNIIFSLLYIFGQNCLMCIDFIFINSHSLLIIEKTKIPLKCQKSICFIK